MTKTRKILAVDDALYQRRLYQEILEDAGYVFQGVSTGEEAIEILRDEKPDLVLLDITLPGKSGLETLEDLMKIDPSLKIIMVSAQAQKLFIMQALKAGALDYVTKPMNREKLLGAIQKALAAESKKG